MTLVAIQERTASLTQKLKLTSTELEEAQKREEELAETAATALIPTGMTREQAKNQLGLD